MDSFINFSVFTIAIHIIDREW